MITVEKYKKLKPEKKVYYTPVHQKTLKNEWKIIGYIKILKETKDI